MDLFGSITADEFEISQQLTGAGAVTVLKKTGNINIYLIEGIKVDIVNYHYPWLEKALIESNLTLANMKDIAAMKLAAITGRGTKGFYRFVFFIKTI